MGTLNSAIIEKYICETQISIAYATKKDKKKEERQGVTGAGWEANGHRGKEAHKDSSSVEKKTG